MQFSSPARVNSIGLGFVKGEKGSFDNSPNCSYMRATTKKPKFNKWSRNNGVKKNASIYN